MCLADVDGEDDSGVWSRGNSRDGIHNGDGEAKAPRRMDCGIANHTGVWSLRRIIGGHPTQKGRWPWQVAILNRFKVLGHLMPASISCSYTYICLCGSPSLSILFMWVNPILCLVNTYLVPAVCFALLPWHFFSGLFLMHAFYRRYFFMFLKFRFHVKVWMTSCLNI